jgi:hypothetical protein
MRTVRRPQRTATRPRRYVAERWLLLLAPLFRYSRSREAFVLRAVGNNLGPVLRLDRRVAEMPFGGTERRRGPVAQRQASVA